MNKILLSLATLATTMSLFAADSYMIESQILQNKKFIDNPSIVAPFKQAGIAEVTEGKNKYELLMEIDEEKSGMVTVYTNLTLNGKFHKQKATVPLKELITINMDDVQLKVRIIPYQ